MSEYGALVAIDWADQQHAICLLDPRTGKREQSIVKHTPAALQEWALSLRQRFAGPIAVGLEQSRGPLIYSLLQIRLLRPLSDQSSHPGQVSPGFLHRPRQR